MDGCLASLRGISSLLYKVSYLFHGQGVALVVLGLFCVEWSLLSLLDEIECRVLIESPYHCLGAV